MKQKIKINNATYCDEETLREIFKNKKKRTFIISKSVLKTINIIMKYSNGVDTTILHILYLKLFLLLGMYLSNGRACIVKSIQDFWKRNEKKIGKCKRNLK